MISYNSINFVATIATNEEPRINFAGLFLLFSCGTPIYMNSIILANLDIGKNRGIEFSEF